MKALILNSGTGSRMGSITNDQPKCMTAIDRVDTILSRQLKQLATEGITEVIITTGKFDDAIRKHCASLNLPLSYNFIVNSDYKTTNYIYSIYLARNHIIDDIIMMHGDLVFEDSVLSEIINQNRSVMAVSSLLPLPMKDFKAEISDNRIFRVGIDVFNNAMTAQPLYYLKKNDWKIWLDAIIRYTEEGKTGCYAENAFNEISDKCAIYPYDIYSKLCAEIDDPDDLDKIKKVLAKVTQDQ